MNHTTRPPSLSNPDYEHCVLSAFEMQEVNVESECNATGEMNAVLVNIMGMPRTDAEEVARILLAPYCECHILRNEIIEIRVLYLHL